MKTFPIGNLKYSPRQSQGENKKIVRGLSLGMTTITHILKK